jgi:hypothetical protein
MGGVEYFEDDAGEQPVEQPIEKPEGKRKAGF